MLVSKTMPDTIAATPDWLREMETILEELNEGVVVVDHQLRVIFANKALTRMGRFERNEIQGCTPDAIFPSEDLPYINRQHESGHRYGRHRSEFYLPRKDGTKMPAIFSGRVIQGPDKQEYVLLIVTDISAQKSIEEQLRESNSLLQKRQDEMEAELALAAHVQQSLAPHSLIWKNIAVEAYYSPARTIGGDFGVVLPQGDGSSAPLAGVQRLRSVSHRRRSIEDSRSAILKWLSSVRMSEVSSVDRIFADHRCFDSDSCPGEAMAGIIHPENRTASV
jgi:PAS domain S-box-containing protein